MSPVGRIGPTSRCGKCCSWTVDPGRGKCISLTFALAAGPSGASGKNPPAGTYAGVGAFRASQIAPHGTFTEVTKMMFKKIRKYLVVLMSVLIIASFAIIPTGAAVLAEAIVEPMGGSAYYCSGCGQLCPVGRDYFGGLQSWSQGGSTYNRFYGQTSTSTSGQMCFATATLYYLGVQCDFASHTCVNGAYATTGNFTGISTQYSGTCNHNVW